MPTLAVFRLAALAVDMAGTGAKIPCRSACSMTSLSSSSSRHAVNMTALGLNVVDVAAFEDVVTLSLLRENCIDSSGLGRRYR